MNYNFMDRYARHEGLLLFDGVRGPVDILRNARIALVGLGGVGCPLSVYLAASGIGKLYLYDNDVVSWSNLNRQFLYAPPDVGRPKVEVAAAELSRLYPESEFIPRRMHVGGVASKGIPLEDEVEFVIDCTDLVSFRFENSCSILVSGTNFAWVSAFQECGEIGILPTSDDYHCYRDYYPSLAPDILYSSKKVKAVLGASCGAVASTGCYHILNVLLRPNAAKPFVVQLDMRECGFRRVFPLARHSCK